MTVRKRRRKRALWLKVFRLVGMCAQCGCYSDPVFCSKACEDKYLEERLKLR